MLIRARLLGEEVRSQGSNLSTFQQIQGHLLSPSMGRAGGFVLWASCDFAGSMGETQLSQQALMASRIIWHFLLSKAC